MDIVAPLSSPVPLKGRRSEDSLKLDAVESEVLGVLGLPTPKMD